MRGASLTILSILALLAALVVCGMAAFLAFDVSGRLAARGGALSSDAAQIAQQASNARLEALAEDTAGERSSLNDLLDTDVVGIANTIESAGSAAGAETSIGDASSDTLSGAPAGVNELEFIAVSNGTFAEVMQAARLFETLPIPSEVDELDFETNPNAAAQKDAPWQLTAHILVLTDADTSS